MIAVSLSRSSPAKRAVRAFRFRISYLIQMNPRPTEALTNSLTSSHIFVWVKSAPENLSHEARAPLSTLRTMCMSALPAPVKMPASERLEWNSADQRDMP